MNYEMSFLLINSKKVDILLQKTYFESSLVEKCFHALFFVFFFSHTRSDNGDSEKMTAQISVFSPNRGKTAKNEFRIWWYFIQRLDIITAWKEYVLEVFLVRILPHLDWIWVSPYSVQMRENTDQKTSEYEHILRREFCWSGSTLFLDFYFRSVTVLLTSDYR